MYVESDFLLALIKPDDWLSERAESIYREHGDDLWTSEYTLIELMLVAYREERNVERVVANANALVDVRGDGETVVAAANYVTEHGLTPFDAMHLVRSEGDRIVSSDSDYDPFADRLPLEPV